MKKVEILIHTGGQLKSKEHTQTCKGIFNIMCGVAVQLDEQSSSSRQFMCCTKEHFSSSG